MNEIYILNFLDSLNKIMEPLKKFIMDHYDNPILWLALFVLGVFVFQVTYSALQREK